jgi:hypothetical protein
MVFPLSETVKITFTYMKFCYAEIVEQLEIFYPNIHHALLLKNPCNYFFCWLDARNQSAKSRDSTAAGSILGAAIVIIDWRVSYQSGRGLSPK